MDIIQAVFVISVMSERFGKISSGGYLLLNINAFGQIIEGG
jgi:hypothetical protein